MHKNIKIYKNITFSFFLLLLKKKSPKNLEYKLENTISYPNTQNLHVEQHLPPF